MVEEFTRMWNEAIDNDPYWQFGELLEEDPELAEALWEVHRIQVLASKRLGFEIPTETVLGILTGGE